MKNNNPISSLNVKVERLRVELSETQEKLRNLREDHSRLIKESIQTDHNFNEMEAATERMCNGCNEKSTDICTTCPLHNVAIKFDLWR